MVLVVGVALVTALACSLVAGVAAQRNMDRKDDLRVMDAHDCIRRQLNDLLAYLRYEVNDYANWDDMYDHMPVPTHEWAVGNLTPGANPGGLTQVMICGDGTRITGRFRNHHQSRTEPDDLDPALPALLEPLMVPVSGASGLAVLGGHPALFASAPVLKNDRSGEPHGRLMCLAYLNQDLLKRFQLNGFTLDIRSSPARTNDQPSTLQLGEPAVTRGAAGMTVAIPIAVSDGTLVMELAFAPQDGVVAHLAPTMMVTGVAVASLAAGLGVLLGWWWLQPVMRIAQACRQRALDAKIRMPINSGLTEIDLLAAEFNQVFDHQHRVNQRLAEALEQDAVSDAMQRRFLTHLGHECAIPMRQVEQIVERVVAAGGTMTPEQQLEMRGHLEALHDRLEDMQGQVLSGDQPATEGFELNVGRFLHGLAEQLQPLAESREVQIRIDAPAEVVMINGKLLTPVLINLASNGIRAMTSGSLTLGWAKDDAGMRWTIRDTGPGIPQELAIRIEAACARGEVMPGESGIGLGLSLALNHVRILGGHLRLGEHGQSGTTFVVTIPMIAKIPG